MGLIFTLLSFFIVLMLASVGLGLVIGVVLLIYLIPFYWWLAGQNEIGKHKNLKNANTFKNLHNATIVYKSWILRKEPILK